MRRALLALGILCAILGALVLAFPDRAGALMASDGWTRVVPLVLTGVLVGAGLFGRGETRVGTSLKYAALWLGIATGIVALYAYRAEISQVAARVTGELRPDLAMAVPDADTPRTALNAWATATTSSAAAVRKSEDGHFWAEATVNGRAVRFMVDTGASTVALTPVDAARVGLDLEALSYTVPVNTANGQTFAAAVKLERVSIGNVQLDNVDAMVLQTGLSTSLLGMSFLGRLSRVEATPETLILRP